jgi:hypothetical protein
MMGRRPKLNDKIRDSIVRDVAAGIPLKFAIQRAGCGVRSINRWLHKARVPLSQIPEGRLTEYQAYRALAAGIEKAQSDAVARNVLKIQKAGEKSWQALAWCLERMHPKEFGADRRELFKLKDEVNELRRQLAEAKKESGTSAFVELVSVDDEVNAQLGGI